MLAEFFYFLTIKFSPLQFLQSLCLKAAEDRLGGVHRKLPYADTGRVVSGMGFSSLNVVTVTSLILQSVIVSKTMFGLNYTPTPTDNISRGGKFEILKFQFIFLGQTQAGFHLAFNGVCVIHNTPFH